MKENRPTALELTTERFVLKPVNALAMARRTFHWTEDRDAFAMLTWATEGWTLWKWYRLLRRSSRRNRMTHLIWPKGAAEPIGLHLLGRDPRTGNMNMGILIADRDWWGKAVVPEVRRCILEDCFERIGAERISGVVIDRNFASIYNYQRLGFTHEGVYRESFRMPDGTYRNQLLYAMLREEWRALETNGKTTS